MCQFEFILEVGDSPQTANYYLCTYGSCIVYGQSAICVNAQIWCQAGERLLRHRAPLLHREEGPLVVQLVALVDRDDQLVEQPRGAARDVDVPVGDRVEGSRVERDVRHLIPPSLRRLPLPAARQLRRSRSSYRRGSAAGSAATGRSPPATLAAASGRVPVWSPQSPHRTPPPAPSSRECAGRRTAGPSPPDRTAPGAETGRTARSSDAPRHDR